MKFIVIFTATLVLILGIAFTRLQDGVVVEQGETDVLSENTEPVLLEDEQTGVGQDGADVKGETAPTALPKATNTPTLRPMPSADEDFDLESFRYPGSRTKSISSNLLLLETDDNADEVTEWYKEKILSLNMSVRSFVTTKTNDNILNKLVGARSGLEVEVEIKKSEGKIITEVSVNLDRN
jgi:hypothetical protein